jgi:hypothetical protein
MTKEEQVLPDFRPPRPDAPKTRSSANRRQSHRADGSHLVRIMAPCQQLMKSEASRSGSSSAAICPSAWAREIRATTLVFQSRTPSAICSTRAEGSAGPSADKVLMSWSGDTPGSRVEGAMSTRTTSARNCCFDGSVTAGFCFRTTHVWIDFFRSCRARAALMGHSSAPYL